MPFFLYFAATVAHRLGAAPGRELQMCFLTAIYFSTDLLNFFSVLLLSELLSGMLGLPLQLYRVPRKTLTDRGELVFLDILFEINFSII